MTGTVCSLQGDRPEGVRESPKVCLDLRDEAGEAQGGDEENLDVL